MTVHEVKVLAGFRFVLTNEDKWEKFCHELHEHVHGDDDSESCHSEHSESGSESGSECSTVSELDDEYCEQCDDEIYNEVDDEEVNVFEAVWDNMDRLIEDLREKFPDIEYHAVKCFHDKEGMDRMIDIGFELGNFNICGAHEASHENIDKPENALNSAKKKTFAKNLNELFLWKYCANKRTVQILGQTDDCIFCSE